LAKVVQNESPAIAAPPGRAAATAVPLGSVTVPAPVELVCVTMPPMSCAAVGVEF
jgi:hypothetical protein